MAEVTTARCGCVYWSNVLNGLAFSRWKGVRAQPPGVKSNNFDLDKDKHKLDAPGSSMVQVQAPAQIPEL